MNFADKPQTKKGKIGEEILDRFLIAKNVVPYKPLSEVQAAHPFDRLCAKIGDKRIFVVEAKAKEARRHYPDTGIDVRHFAEYTAISKRHNVQIFLAFIDADARKIYGGWLSRLKEPRNIIHKGKTFQYPLTHKGIIYFPLEAMRPVGALTEQDIVALRRHTTRAPAYEALAIRTSDDG